MDYSSPIAILFYVMVIVLLGMTLIRRLTKEKLIASIMKSPSHSIPRIEKSYKLLIKNQKLLIVLYVIALPILIYCHFTFEDDDGLFLLIAVFMALMILYALEDIQFKKGVLHILAQESTTIHQFDTALYSQVEFEARLRKLKLIAIPIFVCFTLAPLIAIYFTLGGPWWIYAAVFVFLLPFGIIGFKLGQKHANKDIE